MGIATYNCDILIVGGGLSGLQAAVTIREKETAKKVIIADLGGGASSEVMGFCAPLAPGDSADLFAADTLQAGAGENDPALVCRLCGDAAGVVTRLENLGITFDRNPDGTYNLLQSVGSAFPRVVHHKTTTGKVVMEKYRKALEDTPNTEFHQSKVVKLFTDAGRIAGALAFKNGTPTAYNAGCVILTTGGAAGLYGFSSWTKLLRGSGYALALDAGAELTGMTRVQFEPCVAVYPKKIYGFPIITTLLYEGARLLDRDGVPVVSEPLPKRELALCIASALAAGKGAEEGGLWFDFSCVDETAFQQRYPEYYRKLRPLSDTFNHLRIQVKPAAHTTLGGIKIKDDGSTSVAGLYAAGEAVGGLHGADRIGGNAGLEVLVFGHAAGEAAARYSGPRGDVSKRAETLLAEVRTGQGTANDLQQRLGVVLDETCGTLRSSEGLAKGREQLRQLSSELEQNPPAEKEDYIGCRQMLVAAEQLLN